MDRRVLEVQVDGETRKVFLSVNGPYKIWEKRPEYVRTFISDETDRPDDEAYYFGHRGDLLLACSVEQGADPIEGFKGGVRFKEFVDDPATDFWGEQAERFDSQNQAHLERKRKGYQLVSALLHYAEGTCSPNLEDYELEALQGIRAA